MDEMVEVLPGLGRCWRVFIDPASESKTCYLVWGRGEGEQVAELRLGTWDGLDGFRPSEEMCSFLKKHEHQLLALWFYHHDVDEESQDRIVS